MTLYQRTTTEIRQELQRANTKEAKKLLRKFLKVLKVVERKP